MPKKNTSPKNKASLSQKKSHYFPTWAKALLGVILIVLVSVGVYLLSPATQIQALSCTGNYYYTPQQIYSMAGVKINDRTFLHSPNQVESTLEKNPLIESAVVKLDGQNMSIDVKEKTIIGYFEQDGFQYLVSSDGERIRLTDQIDSSTLVHFPLLAKMEDGSIANMDQVAKEVRRHPERLTKEVLEKIAEIQPWQETYDKDMLKLVLQDGNTVFTSIRSLYMMSAYQQVLANLQGDNVCFLLDGQNGVVNKVACTYMYLSPEKRAENREIPKSVLFKDTGESEENEDSSENSEENQGQNQDQNQPQNEQQNQTENDSSSQEAPATPEQPQQDPTTTSPIPADLSEITDWGPSAVETILHSPSTGLFYDTEHEIYYTYDAGTDTFFPYEP